MLGDCLAAEATGDRANGRTNDGAYRSRSDRADRRACSDAADDTACRCSKPDSDRMRTRRASNRIGISHSLFGLVIVHTILQCWYSRRKHPRLPHGKRRQHDVSVHIGRSASRRLFGSAPT
jgi:hypothetical protein